MKQSANYNPINQYASDLISLCKPLELLNIHYFSHAKINHRTNEMSGPANNPDFVNHYFNNNYHNADIHMSESMSKLPYIIWDHLELKGEGERMLDDARELFGCQQVFTIIEKEIDITHYYHFSTRKPHPLMNQFYLSQMDLLQCFISHFKEKMSASKELSSIYKHVYTLKQPTTDIILKHETQSMSPHREAFLAELGMTSNILIHKNTRQPVKLTPQQMTCLKLLFTGHSAKHIAMKLAISYRTVEHHIEKLREILGAKSSKDLIANYSQQLL